MRSGIFLCVLLLAGCTGHNKDVKTFDIEGHRGCRGLMPENTIPAFIQAVELGVNTLELDVAITADSQVVVSHEPWISFEKCLDTTGAEIAESEEMKYNIYQMTYDQVRRFDCGSKFMPDFPDQIKMKASKPLLRDVFSAVESYAQLKEKVAPYYNIEIKSRLEGDNLYHPEPDKFAALVIKEIKKAKLMHRAIIQSFDERALMAVHDQAYLLQTAFLVSNQLGYEHNLQRLDFKPDIFSPNHIFVTSGMIDFMHEREIRVIPWTVNEVERMQELIDMGIDGLITDYPDKLIRLVNQEQ